MLDLPPYASIYLGAEGMLGGDARDRVAGFWRALGLVPPAEPDHLAALLGLAAALADAERDEPEPARALLWREARRALLAEHLLPWTGAYLHKLAAVAPPAYAAWGALLGRTLAAEEGALGAPATLPLHLREAPALEPPERIGGRAFVDALLAPVRSGMILTPHRPRPRRPRARPRPAHRRAPVRPACAARPGRPGRARLARRRGRPLGRAPGRRRDRCVLAGARARRRRAAAKRRHGGPG